MGHRVDREPAHLDGESNVSELIATPGQTIGPFFGYALPYEGGPELVPAGHAQAIRLTGRVLDGAGEPIPDALIELWQADASGTIVQSPGSVHRDGWTFTGWGRAATDNAGVYTFTTVEPGIVDGSTAPWFALTVFARGLLNRLFTRAYLPHDGLADDPLMQSVDAERRSTLTAVPDNTGYTFDIRLQGPDETVFLRFPSHTD